MAKGNLSNWRRWLQSLSLGLLILVAFAPLSETLHRALALVASLGLLIYLSADVPEFRKRAARILVLVAAVVLLASVFSMSPKSVIFGALGVYGGACLRGVIRQEHAEYLAEREHLR